MNKRSTLVGLMILMMGAASCSSGEKERAYHESDGAKDNISREEGQSSGHSGAGSLLPFLMGYMIGGRVGSSVPAAPGAEAVKTPPAQGNTVQDKKITGNRGAGQQSNITSRGSSSMRGSMGS